MWDGDERSRAYALGIHKSSKPTVWDGDFVDSEGDNFLKAFGSKPTVWDGDELTD